MKNPTHRLPIADIGAQTLRNYSYQSTYGVVLLCGAVAGSNDYKAIWCEQEDDFLAEISDSLFDSYQVKTKTPELGYWDICFKGFISALKIFVRLEKEYPGAIRYFNFICDAHALESQDVKKAHRCPVKLVEATRSAAEFDALPPWVQKGITMLAKKVKCSCDELLPVLRRLRFPPEPLRKEPAVDVLIASHLPLIPCCTSASPIKLKRAAVNAISQVDEASRLASLAPERHYACLDPKGKDNPQLLNKRVSAEDLVKRCSEVIQPRFRYVAEIGTAEVAKSNRDIRRFYAKLRRGSLNEQADTLRSRAIAAEAALLDLATRPDGSSDVHHLRALVKAECDDALAIASHHAEPFGPAMYRQVLKRLDHLATDRPSEVINQPKEVLVGIAGMLTEECKVWWSGEFDVDGGDGT